MCSSSARSPGPARLSAAARSLAMTQPAVSQQLRHLEREAGSPLLVRGPRGVTLTEAGTLLLARADAVASQLHMAGEELSSVRTSGSAGFGSSRSRRRAAVLVPRGPPGAADPFPGLEVTMVEAEPPEAWASVRAGEADVALVFGYDGPPPDDGELVWIPLVVEPLHLVLPPGHRGRPRAALDPGLARRRRVDRRVRAVSPAPRRALSGRGVRAPATHESDDYVVVQNLVARGLGVTVLPRLALQAFRHPDVVVRLGEPFGERHVGIVHRPGATDVPATRALVEQLVSAARGLTADAGGTVAP